MDYKYLTRERALAMARADWHAKFIAANSDAVRLHGYMKLVSHISLQRRGHECAAYRKSGLRLPGE